MTLTGYLIAIISGAITGFICAVPVGPINVAIMEEGIQNGRKQAFIIAIGALLMEMIYCIIAFSGFATLFSDKIILATVELISFLAVTFFGIKYLMINAVTVQGKRAKVVENRLSPHTAFWTGFVRVLVNPNVLLFWIMISAVLISNQTIQAEWKSRMACVIGAAIGIGSWFTLLVIGSARAKNRFSDKTLVKFSQISGVLLLLLSIVIAVRLIGTVAQNN
tara:strand:- start:66 stop:728 length:663 start_codon:yes stop_codon:yes gene_type:complete